MEGPGHGITRSKKHTATERATGTRLAVTAAARGRGTRAGNSIGLRISITARTVRRWESDAPPWPHPDHQAAVEALFQRPIAELGFTPPWAGALPDTSQPERGPVSPAVTASSAAGPLTLFPQRQPAVPLSGSVVTDYVSVTSAHRHMYWVVPPAQLHDVVRPAKPGKSAGQFRYRPPSSARCPGRSTRLRSARAHGIHPGLLRRADEARDKIRASRVFARRAPASPEMLAWLDAVEAEIETRFGNTRKALQLIHHAEGIFATEEPRPSLVWLDWFSPVRLAGFKGNTLLIARQPGPARDTLQDVLDRLPEDSAKQRSVILGDPAAVAVSEKNPERACVLAEEALDHLARYWYATGMDRVRAVRESLTKWESRPCVRQLDERLYDWNTTVNALTG